MKTFLAWSNGFMIGGLVGAYALALLILSDEHVREYVNKEAEDLKS